MPKSAKPDSPTDAWFDPEVEAFMRIYDTWQRTSGRLLKRLWREKGLTERRLLILAMVRRGANRPSHLIELLDVLPSTVTFETDKLVGAGLLSREPLQSDRRVVQLSLTPDGEAVHREMVMVLNGYLRPRIADLAPGELAEFLRIGRNVIGATPRPVATGGIAASTEPSASTARAGPKT